MLFDVDLIVPVDHDFGHVRVGQQVFQWAEPHGFIEYFLGQRRRINPGGQTFAHFLLGETQAPLNLTIALTGTAFALGGIALGVWVYLFHGVDTDRLKVRVPYVYAALQHKLYFDLVYDRVFVGGFRSLSAWLAGFDRTVIDGAVNGAAQLWSATATTLWRGDVTLIDGAVNGVGALVRGAGARAREIETGRLQTYQRLALAVLLLLLVLSVVLLRGA